MNVAARSRRWRRFRARVAAPRPCRQLRCGRLIPHGVNRPSISRAKRSLHWLPAPDLPYLRRMKLRTHCGHIMGRFLLVCFSWSVSWSVSLGVGRAGASDVSIRQRSSVEHWRFGRARCVPGVPPYVRRIRRRFSAPCHGGAVARRLRSRQWTGLGLLSILATTASIIATIWPPK